MSIPGLSVDGVPIEITEAILPGADDEIIVPQNGADSLLNDTSDGESAPSVADRVRQRIKWDGSTDRKPQAESDRKRQSKSTTRPVPPKPREGTLVKPLTEMYVGIGAMVLPFDNACGGAVIANAENCAKSLEALARENEAVRRAILAIISTGAWGSVIVAHLPILIMITVHHGPKDMAERIAPMASMMGGQQMPPQESPTVKPKK